MPWPGRLLRHPAVSTATAHTPTATPHSAMAVLAHDCIHQSGWELIRLSSGEAVHMSIHVGCTTPSVCRNVPLCIKMCCMQRGICAVPSSKILMLSWRAFMQVWTGHPQHPPADAYRGDALLVPHLLPPERANPLPCWRCHPGAHVAVLSKPQGGPPQASRRYKS